MSRGEILKFRTLLHNGLHLRGDVERSIIAPTNVQWSLPHMIPEDKVGIRGFVVEYDTEHTT